MSRELLVLQVLNSGALTLQQAANVDFSSMDLTNARLKKWNFRG